MPDRVKEKLVELLNNSFAEQYEKRGLLTAPHTATDLIANGVTFAKDNNVPSKWISVKDRLPEGNNPGEISENVIVRTTDGEVTTGWLDALGSDKWWLVIGTDDSHTCWGLGYVTHWMPLPQPPKGE